VTAPRQEEGVGHSPPILIDSHCHLDFPDLAGRLPECLAAMAANGVAGAVCIGVNLEDWPSVEALALSNPMLFASVGIHPEYKDVKEADEETLIALAQRPKVIAVGETGLDYHWHKDAPEWQRQRFRVHIRAARRAKRPLIVHCRDAAADTLKILREENAGEAGGIMHCFTESWETARAVLDLGFHLSFSGIVTFKNARDLQEIARKIPLDRLLVETDAPYLAPAPHRGKTNEPAYVRHVAEFIAQLRELSLPEFAAATSENFFRLFPQTRKALEAA